MMDKKVEIKETRIRKVSNLSSQAREEVARKLLQQDESFKYKGYAQVSYTESSPLSVYSVDPIEGDILSISEQILSKIKKR